MKEMLDKALSQYGTREIIGEEDNPVILDYFKFIGHKWVKDDETAWCGAFINWCAKKSGLEHTGKLDARSWLKVGEEVKKPQLGDIVIIWRVKPDSWQGHVGIYINENEKNIYMLGGNQSNMVKVSPYSKSRLLGYRRLRLLKDIKSKKT